MYTRAIRGAITVDENSVDALKSATVELLTNILQANEIELEDISHVIFSLTKDIDCAFPAKFARTEMGFDSVPMECYQELNVVTGLNQCLRVLMVVNTEKSQKELEHSYLKGAKLLRSDLLK